MPVGIELGAACMPREHASDRATMPSKKEKEGGRREQRRWEKGIPLYPLLKRSFKCHARGKDAFGFSEISVFFIILT